MLRGKIRTKATFSLNTSTRSGKRGGCGNRLKPTKLRSALMDFTEGAFAKKEWPETRHRPSGEQACLPQQGRNVTAVFFRCQISRGHRMGILLQNVLDSEAWVNTTKSLLEDPTNKDRLQLKLQTRPPFSV